MFSLTLLVSAYVGCSSDSHHDDPIEESANVVYLGATTDEALARLLDRAPEDSSATRLTFSSPADGAELQAASPVSFEFRATSADTRNLNYRANPMAATLARRVRWDLQTLLGPLRSAAAHGTPFNGSGYLLTFSDAKNTTQLRVFTDQGSFTPGSSDWRLLAGATQPLKLDVIWANFEENSIAPGAGPFVGGTLEFSIR